MSHGFSRTCDGGYLNRFWKVFLWCWYLDGGGMVCIATTVRSRRASRASQGARSFAHEAFILDLVGETPDIALHEIAERLAAERRVSACPATVWHFFNKRGITFKKRNFLV